ncbi:ABC-2 type transport system permease protein [Propionibacterium cyclohexanicum]|uniref:ABC-2 type transport system permease protein n=1 Tax=Propionibacterium cyclohexanicum TaxID=64702 RepID=A0A1H9RYV2_9ACTN|nr:ABC transporter permease [Propionibacterium cyclohexanicum]SER77970.1 ABC-2 type transport system permease protein [Propionibacterium cyclohexanicum]
MSTQHNLGTVIRFEVTRALAKRSFWLATLAMPAFIALVMVLQIGSSSSISDQTQGQASAHINFAYVDDSGLVNPQIASAAGGTRIADQNVGVEQVRSGALDAFVHYPADPSSQPVQISGRDVGMFASGKYEAVAKSVLTASVSAKIGDPRLAAISSGQINSVTTTYKDGAVSGGLREALPALLFPVLFLLAIMLLGNQMLSATLEEKENRVTEMILTTIEPDRLIVGKIISLFIVGFVQFLVFSVPTVLGYIAFRDRMSLPNIDLSTLVFSPSRLIIGFLLLLGGFALVAGSLVALGAVMPTAKDAGPVFSAMILLVFMPLYASALIISDPSALIVRFFSIFPYSAPLTAMARNALGTLPVTTAIATIVWLFALAAVALVAAVRLFKYGSLSYGQRLSLRTLLPGGRERGGARG